MKAAKADLPLECKGKTLMPLYVSTAADSRQHALYSPCMLVFIRSPQPSVQTQSSVVAAFYGIKT
jgi:hypothetical protein